MLFAGLFVRQYVLSTVFFFFVNNNLFNIFSNNRGVQLFYMCIRTNNFRKFSVFTAFSVSTSISFSRAITVSAILSVRTHITMDLHLTKMVLCLWKFDFLLFFCLLYWHWSIKISYSSVSQQNKDFKIQYNERIRL